eukprot:TRINITY_DN4912_c0_g1_i1.p1 TRINITY_DN4912_c0_g1~~TRINITY_DN4912_c0_g1_i1.p1  ORF type:complete len:202 (+),score=54.64 TRINITY_DN4912_c0_g1_i1:211-816(+)
MGCLNSKGGGKGNDNATNGSGDSKTTLANTGGGKAATVNIVFAGDPGVGKTSIIGRFKDGVFGEASSATTQGESIKKNITIDGDNIELRIWDTGGQERYTNITSSYYRFADLVVMVYDVSNKETFEHLRNWKEQVDRYCPDSSIKMVVGNKTDLSSVVDSGEASSFASSLGSQSINCSAKEGTNIDKLFELAAKEVLKHKA